MSDIRNGVYRLDLGGTVIGLECEPPELAAGFAGWFDRPSAALEPHITLALERVLGPYDRNLPVSLVTTKKLAAGGAFDIADGLITGSYDSKARRGIIRANEVLFEGRLVRILEQIFYQAYFSARNASREDAFLIHSSAVIAEGGGYLFVGPSEAGKSTAAECSAAYHVLGDEMHLIVATEKGLEVQSTGFNGLFRNKKPGRAPLRAVFLLNQAPAHGLGMIDPALAATALAAEVAPPVGLDETAGPDTLPAMVDAAATILSEVPVRRLDFTPDSGFWDVILKEFG